MPKKVDPNKPKRPACRPFKDINVELLKRMAQRHCTYKEMADCLGCTEMTLRNRYFSLIEEQKGQGKLNLRDAQWRILDKGSSDMAKWLGRSILKQNEGDTSMTDVQHANLSAYTDSIDQARQEDSEA